MRNNTLIQVIPRKLNPGHTRPLHLIKQPVLVIGNPASPIPGVHRVLRHSVVQFLREENLGSMRVRRVGQVGVVAPRWRMRLEVEVDSAPRVPSRVDGVERGDTVFVGLLEASKKSRVLKRKVSS